MQFVLPAMLLVGALLGLLGGGGALLAVPLLRLAARLEPHDAVALALPIVATASAAAVLPPWRAGRVHARLGLRFAALGLLGALIAGRFSHHVPGTLLLVGLAAVMARGAQSLWRCRSCDDEQATAAPARQGARPRAADAPPRPPLAWYALGIGALTGLSGVGGGFLIVPTLALRAGLGTRAASATALIVIAVNAAGGLLGHLLAGRAPWASLPAPLVAGALLAAAGGALAGSLLAGRVPPPVLRRGFAVLVLVAAASLVASAI